MQPRKTHGYPVLIIGAGRGGSALLEMFLEDGLVDILAIADKNPDAPGLALAKSRGIPAYLEPTEAIHACRNHPDCIVYNLTHDDTVAHEVGRVFPNKKVTSNQEAKLFWQMVTNLQRTKGELEKSQKQLQAIISNAMDGIITIDETGEIQGFNPAAEDIFGYAQHEVLGKNVNILMPDPIASEHAGFISRYLHTGVGKIIGVRGREVTALRKGGDTFPMELSASEMMLGGQRYFVGIVRDITERKEAEQKIKHLAHHDYLTGLPNRTLFLDRIEQSIALAHRQGGKEAVLFLDLDGFKQVNDGLGHDVGDQLLKGVAERLKKTVRASDTVARVGGDEFIVMVHDVGAREDASHVAGKIIYHLSESFDFQGKKCRVGCSIGIAIYPDDATEPSALLKKSDEAMYVSKQKGKNSYTFYSEIPPEARQ